MKEWPGREEHVINVHRWTSYHLPCSGRWHEKTTVHHMSQLSETVKENGYHHQPTSQVPPSCQKTLVMHSTLLRPQVKNFSKRWRAETTIRNMPNVQERRIAQLEKISKVNHRLPSIRNNRSSKKAILPLKTTQMPKRRRFSPYRSPPQTSPCQIL